MTTLKDLFPKVDPEAVLYSAQSLTDAQKAVGQGNLGLNGAVIAITQVTSSGTHTFNADSKFAVVEVLGGGGGGGTITSIASSAGAGAGGGAGGYSKKLVNLSGIASATVIIGAGGGADSVGGNSSYADGVNTLNGLGGSFGTTTMSSILFSGFGGAGGGSSGGDINTSGSRGDRCISTGINSTAGNWCWATGGTGASSLFGAGGKGGQMWNTINGSEAGEAANGYGAGGGGGAATWVATGNGVAGSQGCVVITEYR